MHLCRHGPSMLTRAATLARRCPAAVGLPSRRAITTAATSIGGVPAGHGGGHGGGHGALSPVSRHAGRFGDRVAIADRHGVVTYERLLRAARRIACRVRHALGGQGSAGAALAFLCPNDARYAAAQWAAWRLGSVAVPVFHRHPAPEMRHVLVDCASRALLATEEMEERAREVAAATGASVVVVRRADVYGAAGEEQDEEAEEEEADDEGGAGDWQERPAMIVYTSGTTGRPKGVLSSHGNLSSQISCLLQAWEWSCDDAILHTLPLHHTHGIVNALLCPLAAGASCVMLPEFDPQQVWEHLLSNGAPAAAPCGGGDRPRVNVFMAVPTVYARLIEHYDRHFTRPRVRDFVRGMCKEHIRLMVSGSAALPIPVLERWEQITGHRLLERYGMTELGMVLSNPLRGERVPGAVGTPLPGVEVRIVMDAGGGGESSKSIVHADSKSIRVTPGCEGKEGELQVKGPSVFKEYWRRPLETAESFTSDGWFKTGDTAVYRDGAFRLLGRTSADIIKSGGYKISALEVEWVLLSHPNIADVAVIGAPDSLWGQRVTALVVPRGGASLTLHQLKNWARERMVSYTIPSEMIIMEAIPRNAMGKVNKKHLLNTFFP